MAGAAPAIDVQDLAVVYPDGTRAVDGISFRVLEGEFFGFLGPNGAGKSTTIRALTTLLPKSAGRVSIAGRDLDRSAPEIRRLIGVLSQETVVDVDLTGRENLRLLGRLQGLERGVLDRRVEELLAAVELAAVADRPAGRYSGGMRKRLDLVCALVHRPRLLFLDEPTTGLDPQSRIAIWEHLEKLNRTDGTTIFLTTQNMEEADRLCRRLAIIDHGRLIGGGSPAELKSAVGGDTLSIGLEPRDDAKLKSRTGRILGALPGLSGIAGTEEGIRATAPSAGRILPDVLAALAQAGIRPSSLGVASPTLDDVFLQLTGRKIRAEELGRRETEPFLM